MRRSAISCGLSALAALAALAAAPVSWAGGPAAIAFANYQVEPQLKGAIRSLGDDALGPLMDDWMTAFRRLQPGVLRGAPWSHPSGGVAIGALMFDVADVAPM